ncbi:cytoplasmic protein [Thalassotalea sp. 1_MG-2023]|uniref:cytoplasmic protein n=1 Tax=Thalassotalea sp. 1_MG-2023 TaxID=3062680 RepID=UPI0026E2BFA3|nr:cytoplasmic protein [Thalassotalea sp. 1_MG-2023]MDO6428857.1 cytoplasmic protein [Thalassotalea sp. 1_MG-2023]
MSITISNTVDAVQQNTTEGGGVIVAKKANDQQTLEGQMALKLIESSVINTQTPVGNSGHNINIKA